MDELEKQKAILKMTDDIKKQRRKEDMDASSTTGVMTKIINDAVDKFRGI